MTVTLTYDSTLARVRIDADSLAAADYATIERSTDQVRWTTVRGGTEVEVSAGEFAALVDDYEFAPNVANYYRVRGIVTDPISYVSVGTASSGADGSRTPGAPASIVAGDLVLILASTRNSGTGTVNTPTNWTTLGETGNLKLLGRIYDGVWSMPTVTYTAGASNATTIAQAAAYRNAALTPAISAAVQLNGSAANIAHPALTVGVDDLLLIAAAWKQADWTSVAALTAWSEIGEPDETAGDDAGMVWDYLIQTTAASVSAGSFVVTGGASAISRAMILAVGHAAYLNSQTASTTPTLTAPWLKSVSRPFLNRVVQLGGAPIAPTRAGRGAANEVVGRSLPIAITDVRGSRSYQLRLRTTTDADAQTLDYVLASGDVLYLQAPAGMGVPAGGVYLLVGDTSEVHTHVTGDLIHWTLPIQEVAAPGPDVVPATATWATVLALYATWDDLLAAHSTWQSLLDLIGDPSEVIVA